MVGSTEIDGATGPPKCNDLAMAGIDLRAPVEGDVEAIARVVDAQDTAWWGAPDGDLDDVRDELERVRRAMGSLDGGIAEIALCYIAVQTPAIGLFQGQCPVPARSDLCR